MSSIEICSSGHDRIVYTGRSCPVCDLVHEQVNLHLALAYRDREIKTLDQRVTEKEALIDSLTKQADDLDTELWRMAAKIEDGPL